MLANTSRTGSRIWDGDGVAALRWAMSNCDEDLKFPGGPVPLHRVFHMLWIILWVLHALIHMLRRG